MAERDLRADAFLRLVAGQEIARPLADMGDRDIGGFARRYGEGEADEIAFIASSEVVSVSKARMPVS